LFKTFRTSEISNDPRKKRKTNRKKERGGEGRRETNKKEKNFKARDISP
jgi:hypothetical protein